MRSLYPVLIEYTPFQVLGQKITSEDLVRLRGIAFTILASKGKNIWSITSVFQQRSSSSINEETLISGKWTPIGDRTLSWFSCGSQWSWKILIEQPSPILHFMPFLIVLSPLRMVFHAKEPLFSLASKIVPCGKNFDLKNYQIGSLRWSSISKLVWRAMHR